MKCVLQELFLDFCREKVVLFSFVTFRYKLQNAKCNERGLKINLKYKKM